MKRFVSYMAAIQNPEGINVNNMNQDRSGDNPEGVESVEPNVFYK